MGIENQLCIYQLAFAWQKVCDVGAENHTTIYFLVASLLFATLANVISISVHVATICSRLLVQTWMFLQGQNTRRFGGTLFCERGQGLVLPTIQP
jgi:hypothetical protein